MAPACGDKTTACLCRTGAALLLLVAVVPLGLGIWCTSLYVEYTPVYKDVVCRPEGAKLDNSAQNNNSSMQEFNIHVTMVCDNPNRYPITMSASTKGHDKAYVGANRTALVSEIELPPTTLPRYSTGSLPVTMAVKATQDDVLTLYSDIAGTGAVPVFLTLGLRISVDVRFFHREWKVSQALLKDCGIAMAGVLTATPKLSKMVCASSFEDLTIPPIGDFSPVSSGLRFAAEDIEPDTVAAGTMAKDIGLGTAMAWGYGLFLIFVCTASCLLVALRRRLRRHAKKAAAAKEASSNSSAAEEEGEADAETSESPDEP